MSGAGHPRGGARRVHSSFLISNKTQRALHDSFAELGTATTTTGITPAYRFTGVVCDVRRRIRIVAAIAPFGCRRTWSSTIVGHPWLDWPVLRRIQM